MSVLRDINYLKRVFKHPCNTGNLNWQIVIETAFEAALPELFAFNQFSCMDILKTRAGISWKHGRALKAILTRNAQEASWFDGVKFWYDVTGAGLAERALWYWFVAEQAADLFTNWSSLMYAEAGCDLPYAGQASASAGTFDVFSGGEGKILFTGVSQTPCVVVGISDFTINPGCNCTVSAHGEFTRLSGPPCGCHVELRSNTTGQSYAAGGNMGGDQPGITSSIALAENISGGGFGNSVSLYHVCDGVPFASIVQLDSAKIFMNCGGKALTLFPVSCNPRKTTVPVL